MTGPVDLLRQLPVPGVDSPDADIIRACAEHVVNMDAFNNRPAAEWKDDDDPLWLAYCRTRDAISEAEPRTIEGIVAKARIAVVEATNPDGSIVPEGSMGALWRGTSCVTSCGCSGRRDTPARRRADPYLRGAPRRGGRHEQP